VGHARLPRALTVFLRRSLPHGDKR
jgi:hypothetical protein